MLLEEKFGKEAPLTQTRGKKVHNCLVGMTIDFSEDAKVKFLMQDYIEELTAETPPDMDGEAITPASAHLFEVNQVDPIKLSKPDSEMFHTFVAKLLFLCKRARPDIQTAVSFLCTCVAEPDTDDYKNLTRVVRYLPRATASIPLTLEAGDLPTPTK